MYKMAVKEMLTGVRDKYAKEKSRRWISKLRSASINKILRHSHIDKRNSELSIIYGLRLQVLRAVTFIANDVKSRLSNYRL
jgi:hypothetical protein